MEYTLDYNLNNFVLICHKTHTEISVNLNDAIKYMNKFNTYITNTALLHLS